MEATDSCPARLPANYNFTFESPTRWGSPRHSHPQGPSQLASTFTASSVGPQSFSLSTLANPPSSRTPYSTSRSSSPTPDTISTGDSMRSTQPTSHDDVLPPIFVDQLAKVFTLTTANIDILRAFVKIGSVAPSLSQPDLATRSYLLAAILSRPGIGSSVQGTTAAARPVTIEEVTAIMADLKIQLEDSFRVSKEQTENARLIAQDLIYEPGRTNFKLLWTDVQKHLAKEQNMLRMNNIFGSPHREKVLVSLLKRQCSSVRNAFRQDIRDSISSGKSRRSLIDFTWQTAVKYRRAGAADLDVSSTIKNALMRRFALENPDLLNIAENENHSDSDPEVTHVDPDDGPARKKRKKNSRGRVANGECFWSRFEDYLAPLIAQMGTDMSTSEWKKFSEELIAQDRRNFPHVGDQIELMPNTEPFVAGVSVHPQQLPTFAAPASAAAQPGRSEAFNLSSLLN